MDEILLDDFRLLSQINLPWGKLQNVTVLITGATGLIGTNLVKALAYTNNIGLTSINVIGLVRNYKKAEDIYGDILNNPSINIICQDILEPINYANKIDYIIHGASVTTSKMFITEPIETILIAINGTKNILDLAIKKQVKGIVYLSSMETYGVTDETKEQITENDYGFIDPLDVRSSYSEGKRMVECLCNAYSVQYHVPVKIARLAQTFGPLVDNKENRVFAQFAKSVIKGEDIILHTHGDSERPCLYIRDAISAIILLLLEGEVGEAYNVANPASYVSVYNMARLVSELDPNGIVKVKKMAGDIKKFGYAPTVKLNLSTQKIEALGWKAEVGLREGYIRLIKSLSQT